MAITEAIPPTGVEDLDSAGVLACAGEAETAERRAGLGKLELALRWCVLHPATTESGAALWGDAGLALAVVALIRFQRATDLSGRIAAGIGAMALGVLGLVMVAVLVV